MKPRKLIPVRHGIYDGVGREEDSLTEAGVLATERLRELLRPHIEKPAAILSSHYARAQQTARILAEPLMTEVIVDPMLLSQGYNGLRCNQVLNLLYGQKAETVIAVTHWEYTRLLPQHIETAIFGLRHPTFPDTGLDYSNAFVIDLNERTCEHVVP